jgi:GNAT superfamily N-acetyltransferase
LAEGLTLRVATPEDAARVSEVLASSYGTLWRGAYAEEALAAVLPLVSRARPELLASGRYFLALRGEAVMAVGGWSPDDPASGVTQPGQGHVRHFATHPAHLRQGAAGLILRRCLEEAQAAGVREMLCLASLPSEAFYAAYGFVTLRREETRIGGRILLPSLIMRRAG